METNGIMLDSTYRMQLHDDFTFDDAAAWMPYLHFLDVTHLFCSPILQASPGLTYGYGVADHSRVSEECGGEEAFRRLSQAAHGQDIGVIIDVVPNHMTVPIPIWHNHALWNMLRRGPESTYVEWFDLDMTDSQVILMSVFGNRIGRELKYVSLITDVINGEERPVVTYYDQVFLVRPGTEDFPLDEPSERQRCRLTYRRIGSEELSYRRFFGVDTLTAIRVEGPAIFEATHRKLTQLHTEELIDGFRIDHIDDLANSRRYLANLQCVTGGYWVVVEKILEYDEALPADLECARATGYDSLLQTAGLFHVPGSVLRFTDLWEHMSGSGRGFASTVLNAKRTVVKESLFMELDRLVNIVMVTCGDDIRLRDHIRRQLNHIIRGLLYQFGRYRAYVEPGRTTPESEREIIVETTMKVREYPTIDELGVLDFVMALVLDETGGTDMGGAVTLSAPLKTLNQLPGHAYSPSGLQAEFMVRFVQTCGPVMAKSEEDMASYRWNQFVGINEAGSDPNIISINQDGLHGFYRTPAVDWSISMTALSIHDTKRSEDAHARLAVLIEYPCEWEHCVSEPQVATSELRPALLDGGTGLFLW